MEVCFKCKRYVISRTKIFHSDERIKLKRVFWRENMAELGRGEKVPVASGALYNHESWMHGFLLSLGQLLQFNGFYLFLIECSSSQ